MSNRAEKRSFQSRDRTFIYLSCRWSNT